jgi:NADH:ubiquinone oxidoreductase subunit E
MNSLQVTLCLGSSCHARGNRQQLESLTARLATRNLKVSVELKGSLCLGRCSEGPLVLIDGQPVVLGPDEDLVDRIAAWAQGTAP